MDRQLHHYFLGAVAFAFVVVWATLGATDALVAVLACTAAANLDRLVGRAGRRAQQRSSHARRRPQRRHLATRPLDAEDDHPLVPDDPSLVISMS